MTIFMVAKPRPGLFLEQDGKSRLTAAFSYIHRFGDLQAAVLPKHTCVTICDMSTLCQDGFSYDDRSLATIEKYLSSERLAAYSNYARGDKWVAIRLYERNTEISEALYGVVQATEVTLRNAIHSILSVQLGSAEWYESFSLEPSERETVEDAKKSVLDRPEILTPGRIVAELNFAFWVRLFSAPYDKTLWVPHLRKISPLKLQSSRRLIHGRLVELKTLRNRIAHHERLICGKRNVKQDYTNILETIGWVSPVIRDWVESTNCCQERFTTPLPKKPKFAQQGPATKVDSNQPTDT
jgi:hypothetical protein